MFLLPFSILLLNKMCMCGSHLVSGTWVLGIRVEVRKHPWEDPTTLCFPTLLQLKANVAAPAERDWLSVGWQ